MARLDVIVLGAGIVGTSVALQLATRGRGVALVDRRAVGEETSYGNAGVIEGNTVFPPAFPSDPLALLRIAVAMFPSCATNFASSSYHGWTRFVSRIRIGPGRVLPTTRPKSQ